MTDVAKLLILAGAGFLVVGVAVLLAGRLGFRGMPGDVAYRGEHVRVYFPVVTCLLLSVLMTAGMWLWQWLTRR